jgi:hypothetical protein
MELAAEPASGEILESTPPNGPRAAAAFCAPPLRLPIAGVILELALSAATPIVASAALALLVAATRELASPVIGMFTPLIV